MPGHLLRDVLAALDKAPHAPTCFIIAGDVGEGKSRTAERFVEEVRAHRISIGGVVAPRLLDGQRTIGYDVRDVVTGEERPLVRLTPPGEPIGKYFVRAPGVAFVKAAVDRDLSTADVVVLDEIGRLELRGAGHAPALEALLASRVVPVITVRSSLVDEVCRAFGISDASVHAVGDSA